VPYRAEYIWIDGSEPTQFLRSKTKVLPDGADLPIWGFDGSSTNQAPGSESDCVLRPVRSIPDPIRGGDNVLVLAEVLNTDLTPHKTNTRAACVETAERYAAHDARKVLPDYADASRKRVGEMPPGCDCARVVLGQIYPNECRLYGAACTPRKPVGPCMVSDEGACRIWWSGGVRENVHTADREATGR